MIIIGLTGASGSGKGEVTKLFAARGVPAIDTDEVYRRLTAAPSPCVSELTARFGEEILDRNGGVDRKKLAAIVFCGGDEQRRHLADLNRITHKHILRSCRITISHLRERGVIGCVVDAPLLFEAHFEKECDFVIAVVADRETRIRRVMRRDFITRAAAEARINAQKDNSYYSERSDFTIYNDGSVEALAGQVDAVFARIFTGGTEC